MNILFVCTGNTCRSSMAEALLKDMLNEKEKELHEIKVSSAGIFAIDDMDASPQAIIAMKNQGIDLTKHKSRLITKQMIEEADLILTMTVRHKDLVLEIEPSAKGKTFTLKEYSNLDQENCPDIIDPFGQSVEVYNKTANEIKKALEIVVKRVRLEKNDNFTDM